jgi:DNA polymerase elongation subunit (family B)
LEFGRSKATGDNLEKINKKYNFKYKVYVNEADMLYDFLWNYARHAPLITGWHFWNYDWRYITNRCKKLNLDISWMSPTKQWYKHKIMDKNERADILLPQHKLIVDHMEIYKNGIEYKPKRRRIKHGYETSCNQILRPGD